MQTRAGRLGPWAGLLPLLVRIVAMRLPSLTSLKSNDRTVAVSPIVKALTNSRRHRRKSLPVRREDGSHRSEGSKTARGRRPSSGAPRTTWPIHFRSMRRLIPPIRAKMALEHGVAMVGIGIHRDRAHSEVPLFCQEPPDSYPGIRGLLDAVPMETTQ